MCTKSRRQLLFHVYCFLTVVSSLLFNKTSETRIFVFTCDETERLCSSPDSPAGESLCLASGLVIISQLDKVINDPAKPAGPGTDANMQSDSERPELDAERGGPLIWDRMPCFWAVPLSINNLE